jgi:hypothetical protein
MQTGLAGMQVGLRPFTSLSARPMLSDLELEGDNVATFDFHHRVIVQLGRAVHNNVISGTNVKHLQIDISTKLVEYKDASRRTCGRPARTCISLREELDYSAGAR